MLSESRSPIPSQAVAQLAMIAVSRQPLETVLIRIAELAKTDIPGIDESSVSLLREGRPFTFAGTGDVARRLEEQQYENGSGPCLDAALSGLTIEIPDTATARDYPEFAREARSLGVRHSVSVGLPVTSGTRAALNLYGRTGTSERTRTGAQDFARFAAVALANAVDFTDTSQLALRLQQGARTRAVIEQAKGILMGRHRCSPDEAMRMLIAASQRSGRRLRDIAAEMVQDVPSSS